MKLKNRFDWITNLEKFNFGHFFWLHKSDSKQPLRMFFEEEVIVKQEEDIIGDLEGENITFATYLKSEPNMFAGLVLSVTANEIDCYYSYGDSNQGPSWDFIEGPYISLVDMEKSYCYYEPVYTDGVKLPKGKAYDVKFTHRSNKETFLGDIMLKN